jgi:antibiotic biosynthesis monooxygenase (ABM) superfamily enzyme
MQETNEEPVTVIISRRIKPGRERDFEAWLAGVTQKAHNFPGYLGANLIRPSNRKQPEYVTIFRFDSYINLARWENSSVRSEWLKRADEMTLSDNRTQKMPGLEFWFTPLDSSAPASPPRYKMTIVLTIVIFTLSILISPVLTSLFSGLPQLLRQFIIVSIQVTLITYFILPFLTWLLSRLLFAVPLAKKK